MLTSPVGRLLLSHVCRLTPPDTRTLSSKKYNLENILAGYVSKDEKRTLKEKLEVIERDSYKEAVPNQLNELAALNTSYMLQGITTKPKLPPSRSALKRDISTAVVLLRREMFQRAQREGLPINQARIVADRVVECAEEVFQRRMDRQLTVAKDVVTKYEAKEAQTNATEKKLYDMAFQMFEQIYKVSEGTQSQSMAKNQVKPDPRAEKIFVKQKSELGYFDVKKCRPASSGFWESMENRQAEINNLSAGPSNAFEEQILWTEQGRLWPYPIDNEYLMGDETNISFTEHIFIDKYVANKHKHLPKTGPIAHFMELVCVGLSKNPYMTLAKKHAHLDSFATFFSPEMIDKVHRLHEEAEKQAL